jgi:Mce-associated membrane protein
MTSTPAIADDTTDQHDTATDSAAEDGSNTFGDRESGQPQGQAAQPPTPRRWLRRVAARWRLIAVAGLLLVCAGAASGLYFGQYRTDHDNSTVSAAAVTAASEGSVALLSYAADSLDHDLATARSHLTGDFLTYYAQFADQFVAPAARQRDIHASATVTRAAAMDVHADNAKVLIFLNQTMTSHDNPDPVQTASSVVVGLTKVDGRWLISSFDPV